MADLLQIRLINQIMEKFNFDFIDLTVCIVILYVIYKISMMLINSAIEKNNDILIEKYRNVIQKDINNYISVYDKKTKYYHGMYKRLSEVYLFLESTIIDKRELPYYWNEKDWSIAINDLEISNFEKEILYGYTDEKKNTFDRLNQTYYSFFQQSNCKKLENKKRMLQLYFEKHRLYFDRNVEEKLIDVIEKILNETINKKGGYIHIKWWLEEILFEMKKDLRKCE